MIDLSGSAFAWPTEFRERLSDVWSRSDAQSAFLVPPSRGLDELRTVIGQYTQAAHPVVTGGLRSTAPFLVAGRRTVLIERPTFLGVVEVLHATGAHVKMYYDSHLLDALTSHDPRTTVCWITAPARNPDGYTPDQAGLDMLAQFLNEGGAVIRNATNAFHSSPAIPGALSLDPARTPPVQTHVPGEIVIGSFSKLIGSWARLGWIGGDIPDKLRQLVRHVAPALPMQRFWSDALSDPWVRESLRARAEFVRAIANHAATTLLGTQPTRTTGSSFLVRVLSNDPVEVFAKLGIKVNDGRAFGADRDTVRLSFLGVQEPDLAHHALERARGSGLIAPYP